MVKVQIAEIKKQSPFRVLSKARPYGCRTLLRSGTATPKSPKVLHLHATTQNRLETEV